LSVPLAIIIAGGLIAVSVVYTLKPHAAAPAAGNTPAAQPSVDIKDVKITKDTPFIGDPNAKVTLAYWFDYQCPFCKQFELETLPVLIQKYVNTGKLKIVFKDFPFLGKYSINGTEYEHAIWETYPDKFAVWQEAMFKAQDAEGDRGFGSEPSILKLIGTIPGMDANRLKALVAQKKKDYDAMATTEQQEGVTFGVEGTPGFVTGKQSIAGAQPPNIFLAAIDTQLK